MQLCSICNGGLKEWCTTPDWEYFTSEESYSYFQCIQCLSLFIQPVPSGKLSEIYPDHYYSFGKQSGNFVFQIKQWLDERYFSKLLKKITGQEVHVLDIGGGTGWLLGRMIPLDQRIKSTAIVDINAECRNIAEKNGHTFHLSRIEDFHSTKKFDLILMLNVIEHVEDPAAVLLKVSSLLTDSGICLIKTPNVDSLDARLFRSTYWGGLHTPRHWTIYTASGFIKQLAALPLSLKSLKYTQGAPFWAYSILVKLYGRKLWIKKNPLINHFLFTPISALFAVFDFIRAPFAPTSQMFVEIKKKSV